MTGTTPLETALIEELERFSGRDARGEVCVLNGGKLIHPRAGAVRRIELSPQDQAAAGMVIDFLVEGLTDERGVHSESALSLLGGLLGHGLLAAYRADWSGIDGKFTAVYIEDVNADLLETAQFLWPLLSRKDPSGGAVSADIPEDNAPFPQVLGLVPQAFADMDKGLGGFGIAPGNRRWVMACALPELLDMTRDALAPAVGLRIALRSMVRAAKTPAAHLKELGN